MFRTENKKANNPQFPFYRNSDTLRDLVPFVQLKKRKKNTHPKWCKAAHIIINRY